MTGDDRWRRTLALLREQRGATHRRRLLGLGWTDAVIVHVVDQGLLERDHLGTYALSTARTGAAQHLATSVLAAGRDAALTSTSAARLYGLHGLPRDDRVHVLVPHQRVVQRSDPTLVVRRSRIPDPTRQIVAGVLATGADRTLVELGRDLQVAQLTEVFAHALHEDVVTFAALDTEIVRCVRSRGLPTVRAALALLAPDDPRARARRERSTARLLRDHGLLRPHLGHRVDAGGANPVELDLAYPDVQLGIELDGNRWHRTPDQKALRRDPTEPAHRGRVGAPPLRRATARPHTEARRPGRACGATPARPPWRRTVRRERTGRGAGTGRGDGARGRGGARRRPIDTRPSNGAAPVRRRAASGASSRR